MSDKPILLFLHGVGSGDQQDAWQDALVAALIDLGYPGSHGVTVVAPKYAHALRGVDDNDPLPELTVKAPAGERRLDKAAGETLRIPARSTDPGVEGQHRPHHHLPGRCVRRRRQAISGKASGAAGRGRTAAPQGGEADGRWSRPYDPRRWRPETAGLVRAAVPDDEAPVRGVLCFVDGDWPLIGGAFTIRDVDVVWPKKLAGMLGASGPLDPPRIQSLQRRLASAFPSA